MLRLPWNEMTVNRYFSHKDEGQAFHVTKYPMSMTFPPTLSAVKVANSKIQKKQCGSEQGEKGVWEWKEEHGTEDVKREGSLQWTEGGTRMKRETHRKVGHTLIPPCTVVYLCACALLDWIPQYLGGFWWCIPSTQPAHWALLTLSTKLFMEAREWKDCSLFPLFHYISS